MPRQLTLFATDREAFAEASPPQPAAPSERALSVAHALPRHIRLGTSSWHFRGWAGLVWNGDVSEQLLSREGLAAYSAHPLLRTVCVDRAFYSALPEKDYRRYASQVPDDFRFIVKAPMAATAAILRDNTSRLADNPCFLDPAWTTDTFIHPCASGLGRKAGVMLFQFPPLGRRHSSNTRAFARRLATFLEGLPHGAWIYAVELRDRDLLTRGVLRAIQESGARYCIGIHPRMPAVAVQAATMGGLGSGPLIVRWNLNAGMRYEDARERYAPFNRLVDEDPDTRTSLGRLIAAHARSGHPVYVIANNKAEGSAPLTLLKLAEETVSQLRLESTKR